MAESIAFIGGGQMAGSLLGGLLAAGHPAARLLVAEPDAARATALRRQYGVEVRERGAEVIAGADALVLAVKPQVLREALAGIAPPADTTVISIAAGVRIAALRGWLGGSAPIVRAMPNTPALLRAGVTGLHAPAQTPQRSRELAARILGAVGAVCWVADEAQLDAVTALSGSGPAYFYLLVEAMIDAGILLGLPRQVAHELIVQTAIGSAVMLRDSGEHPVKLREAVTSPAGTTISAIRELENHGVRAALLAALEAARDRAREIAAQSA